MRKDRVVLLGRFVGIVLLSPLVGWMLVRAWQPDTLLYGIAWDVADLFDVGVSRPNALFMATGLGLYFGILVLFTLDWRKRIQGVLILLGSLIGLGVLAANDILLPNIEPNVYNLAAFVIAAGVVALVERGELIELVNQRDVQRSEFDRALTLLFVVLAGVLLAGYVQGMVYGYASPAIDTGVTAVTFYLLVQFMAYSSDVSVAFAGPRASGKSTVMLGLYYTFKERTDHMTAPTPVMQDLIDMTTYMTDGDDFPIPNTEDFDVLGFNHEIRGYFPKQIRITAWEHGGEHLSMLANELREDPTVGDRLVNFLFDLRTLLWFGHARNKKQRFVYETAHADVGVLLINCGAFRFDKEELELTNLMDVAKRIRKNGGEVLLAATKADLTESMNPDDDAEWQENQDYFDGSFLNEGNRGEPYYEQDLIDELTETINGELQGKDPVKNLMDEADCDVIYPLYYKMQKVEKEGQRVVVPKLDENGNLQPVGHHQLAEEIERLS